jgi:hypothetical protein
MNGDNKIELEYSIQDSKLLVARRVLQAALAPSAKQAREHRLCNRSLAQRVFKVGSRPWHLEYHDLYGLSSLDRSGLN